MFDDRFYLAKCLHLCLSLFLPKTHKREGKLIHSAKPPLYSSFCPATFRTVTLSKAGKSSPWMINAPFPCHLEPLQNTALKFTKVQNAAVNYSSAWMLLLKARTGTDKVAQAAAPRVDAVCHPWQNWDPEEGRSLKISGDCLRLQFVVYVIIQWKALPQTIKLLLLPLSKCVILMWWHRFSSAKRLVNNCVTFNIHRMKWEWGHRDVCWCLVSHREHF